MSEPTPPELPPQLDLDRDPIARTVYGPPRLLVLIATLLVLLAVIVLPIAFGVVGG